MLLPISHYVVAACVQSDSSRLDTPFADRGQKSAEQMTGVAEALLLRRAVKFFDSGAAISDEDVRELIRCAMLSPTAFNLQHWRFVHIRDRSLREQIRSIAFNQPQVTDAAALILICMDLKAWQRNPERYWSHAPEHLRACIVRSIVNYYDNNELRERDEAFRSCGLAAMSLMLAGQARGFDSCPMAGFDFDKVGDLVRLPEDYVIGMMVAIGKKKEDPWPREDRLSLDSVFFVDAFE